MILHRFMSFEQFVDIVVSQRMYLAQVLLWDDPHEARAMRVLVKEILDREASGKVRDIIKNELVTYTHKSIYGQSWTLWDESDAFWRIYSPDKMGVRISVHQSDVLASAKEIGSGLKHGSVRYRSFEEDLKDARALAPFGQRKYSLDPADTCFSKRKEFEHQHEYRLCATLFPEYQVVSTCFLCRDVCTTMSIYQCPSPIPHTPERPGHQTSGLVCFSKESSVVRLESGIAP